MGTKLLWGSIGLFILMLPITYYWKDVTKYNHISMDQKVRKAAIVLGTGVWGNEPSPGYQERLDMAYNLYTKKYVSMIILTGGLGNGNVSEAEAGKQYLMKRRVPSQDMMLEDQSKTTKENLQNASPLLKKQRITEVYLVTHDYHMYRGLTLAKKAGITASPAPVHSKVLFMPFHFLRESYALFKMKLVQVMSS